MLACLHLLPATENFLQSVGIGACVSLLVSILVNVNVTPVMLLLFSNFFLNFQVIQVQSLSLPSVGAYLVPLAAASGLLHARFRALHALLAPAH